MKKLYNLFLLLFVSFVAHSQPHCNEWIKFNISQQFTQQQYLKIRVWQDGIHRITFNDLNQFPALTTNGVDPKYFQIFHKGTEQYIYVYDGSTPNVFDSTDYIEFYGKPNDGSFDTQLYDSAIYQLNPFYSLFNDTAAYFFTINLNTSAVNKRMNVIMDSNFSNYLPVDFVMKDSWVTFHDDYFTGYSQLSVDASYSNGEGFSKDGFGASIGTVSIHCPTPNPYPGGNPNA